MCRWIQAVSGLLIIPAAVFMLALHRKQIIACPLNEEARVVSAPPQQCAQQDPDGLLVEAQALIKAGQRARADTVLGKLVERDDLLPLQRFQVAALLGDAQDYKRAIAVFDSLPPDYPDPFSRQYGLALAYFGDGQYAMCSRTLDALERRGFNKSRLFNLLGLALAKIEQYQESSQAFEKAIRADPRDARSYLTFAAVCAEHSDHERAVRVLSAAMERISGDYRLFLARSAVYLLLGDYGKGQADCDRAMALDPTDSRVYLVLGFSYLGQRRYHQATEVFRKAIQRGLNDKQIYHFLADVLLRKPLAKDTAAFNEALSICNSCLALDPKFAYCYLDRARIEQMAGRQDLAIADLERARGLLPDSRSILYHLGVAYRQVGKAAEAQELFARMKDLTIREFQIHRTMLLLDIVASLYERPV